jgi:hypothetical protein
MITALSFTLTSPRDPLSGKERDPIRFGLALSPAGFDKLSHRAGERVRRVRVCSVWIIYGGLLPDYQM